MGKRDHTTKLVGGRDERVQRKNVSLLTEKGGIMG